MDSETLLTPDEVRDLRETPTDEPNKLRMAMKRAGLTQVQLASRSGMTQSFISSIMCGRNEHLPITTARRFAHIFGCLVDDLFPDREAS